MLPEIMTESKDAIVRKLRCRRKVPLGRTQTGGNTDS